jgi:hypothetical protein
MGSTTPEADLMVATPKKEMFLIDVKGHSVKAFWRIKQKPPRKKLFYVLADVTTGESNRFFILSQQKLTTLMKEYEESVDSFDPRFSGINWGTPIPDDEDKWELLPK